MVHKLLLGHSLMYISDLLTSVADVPARSPLATSSCRGLVNELATGLSLSPHHEHGTGCQQSWSCCGHFRSTITFHCQLKTFLFHSAYGHGKTDDCFVMHPWSSVGGAIQMTQLQLQLGLCSGLWRWWLGGWKDIWPITGSSSPQKFFQIMWRKRTQLETGLLSGSNSKR